MAEEVLRVNAAAAGGPGTPGIHDLSTGGSEVPEVAGKRDQSPVTGDCEDDYSYRLP